MTKTISKKFITLACAAALLLAASGAEAVAPKKKDPVNDRRRTLFATLGQTTMVFEAPKGMCFMDEARTAEGALLKSLKDAARTSGDLLVAVFGDCMELAGLGVADAGESFLLKRKGTISWNDPAHPPSKKATRQEYIEMRAPTYREDAFNEMIRAFTKHGKMKKRVEGALTTATFMANPEDYQFDARPQTTDNGVMLAYRVDSEIEYKKLTTQGITAATLVRHQPLEFSFTQTADRNSQDFSKLYNMMDSFVAQQVRLNQ